jgi:predicted ATPase
MAIWRRGYRFHAAARRRTALPGQRYSPPFLSFFWPAHEIAGQVEESSTVFEEALQIVESTGERWLAAELNRQKGQLLLRQGNSADAEELYRKALSIATEQKVKFWELRAAVSLARL